VARVAVVGNLSRDVVDGGPATPGGCPFFAAEAFRRLGCDAQIVTRFAERDRVLFQPTLDALGVPLTLLPATETTGFTMDYAGDARAMAVSALGEAWEPETAAALEPDVGWVHVAPLLRGDFPPATLEALARNRRLSLDGQGLVRRRCVGPLARDADYEPALLSCVTTLKLSEEEARVVAGGRFDRASARRLGTAEVLLTLGSRGVLIFAEDDETFVPARAVSNVQATGAGDTFMVAYASARSAGCDPVDAARRACELVSHVLEARASMM
jgi:sugar/nucleoside kinase (ribokinase family)